MRIVNWLKSNGEVIKTVTSIIQSVVVIGGIIAAVNAFILSGKIEERERVRNTIPLLEKASISELQEARAQFDRAYYSFIGAEMAGPHNTRSQDYMAVRDIAALERKTGQGLLRLASYYEMFEQCISASICSERAARHALCRDATQLHDDLNKLKRVLENRYASEKFQMLTPHAQDRKRIYASLRGFEEFATRCRAWNKKHPSDNVLVSDGPRMAPD